MAHSIRLEKLFHIRGLTGAVLSVKGPQPSIFPLRKGENFKDSGT